MGISATRPLSPFGENLYAELRRQKLSLRRFSKKLAARSGQEFEDHRRALIRWAYGDNEPTDASVEFVADVLGIKPEELRPDEDDEERLRQMGSLYEQLQLLAQARVAE